MPIPHTRRISTATTPSGVTPLLAKSIPVSAVIVMMNAAAVMRTISRNGVSTPDSEAEPAFASWPAA